MSLLRLLALFSIGTLLLIGGFVALMGGLIASGVQPLPAAFIGVLALLALGDGTMALVLRMARPRAPTGHTQP